MQEYLQLREGTPIASLQRVCKLFCFYGRVETKTIEVVINKKFPAYFSQPQGDSTGYSKPEMQFGG